MCLRVLRMTVTGGLLVYRSLPSAQLGHRRCLWWLSLRWITGVVSSYLRRRRYESGLSNTMCSFRYRELLNVLLRQLWSMNGRELPLLYREPCIPLCCRQRLDWPMPRLLSCLPGRLIWWLPAKLRLSGTLSLAWL